MNKDMKILGLVLVGLFAVFLISGGITGGAIRLWPFGSSAPTVLESAKITTTASTGTCIDLTEGQCKTVCGDDYIAGGTWGCIRGCKNDANDCVKEPYNCGTSKDKEDCCHRCCWGYPPESKGISAIKVSETCDTRGEGAICSDMYCHCADGIRLCIGFTSCRECCGKA